MNTNTHTTRIRSRFPRFRRQSAGFVLSGCVIASMVSSAVFWVMYQLVSAIPVELPTAAPKHYLDFVALKRTLEEPEKRQQKPELPPVARLPMPASAPDWGKGDGVPAFVFTQPDASELTGLPGPRKIGIGEREYMPLTEIQPAYPERAIIRNIEGTCVVLYTITKTGSVADVRVDESRCTSTYFHAPSIKAVAKFKYAPRIVDGEPQEARNVAKLFRFSITD